MLQNRPAVSNNPRKRTDPPASPRPAPAPLLPPISPPLRQTLQNHRNATLKQSGTPTSQLEARPEQPGFRRHRTIPLIQCRRRRTKEYDPTKLSSPEQAASPPTTGPTAAPGLIARQDLFLFPRTPPEQPEPPTPRPEPNPPPAAGLLTWIPILPAANWLTQPDPPNYPLQRKSSACWLPPATNPTATS